MPDSVSPRQARPVDHLVLPTASLDLARERLHSLGFTVAPMGRHPFGTANVCTYLSDGTFLESLAIGQRETCERAAIRGNVFVARDQAFRFRNGDEGFSALVMETEDAKGDHAAFVKAGISAGKILNFARAFVTPDGTRDKAAFRLAFAADLRAPDVFFFTCQRVNVPDVDRSVLQRHENGVVAIREIVLSETNPTDFQYLMQEVVNERDVNAHSFGMDIRAANANIAVLTPAGLEAFFGAKAPLGERGLHLQGIVFAVRDLAHVEGLLSGNGVAFEKRGARIVVKPAAGQGAIFAFEA
ncbi:lactoylglutathione lyase [Phyllobacterium phragmitis]|uniref:Lactoylglutathione lyase n=1 Tax=Phyllobacterium phragmitis TaxID=2670329 RepID=A0A2S9INX3_9HYPH|nr:VOC family protein [Phyllobacterium phragmitis]PRD42234.1 lactoylglutathione lyase [Phyllobacterium phragmitis]